MMFVENSIYFSITVIGIWLSWHSFRKNQFGWVGWPFALLLIQATRDLGISPLTANLWNKRFSFMIHPRVYGMEAFQSGALILTCYCGIAAGLFLAASFSKNRMPVNSVLPVHQVYPSNLVDRAWKTGLIFFIFGLLANLATIYFVSPGRTLAEIASQRAMFTDENALSNPLFGYLRILSPIMQMGALALLLFSKGNKTKVHLGLAANYCYAFLEVIYGGRAKVAIALICIMMVYHYGIKKFKHRDLIKYSLLILVFFSFLSLMRFKNASITDALSNSLYSILASENLRIDGTAWVLKLIPSAIPYTGWENFINSFIRIVPRVGIHGATSLWGYIVDTMYGGINPMSGIGGSNYSTAAEAYSWGGYFPLISFSILSGVLFGAIFNWQRRHSFNPFIKLAIVLIIARCFFPGVQSRLPDTISSITNYIIPISFMAAITTGIKKNSLFFLLIYFDMVALFGWYAFRNDFGLAFMKYFIIATLPIIAILAFKILVDSDPNRICNRFKSNKKLIHSKYTPASIMS